jgi:predicted deacetylase
VSGKLAVALHDVEPRSFARCREIRHWLLQRGVDRITMLVIPAPDLRPIPSRSQALSGWLRGRVAAGDAVAQHGLSHKAAGHPRRPQSWIATFQGGAAAEFPGLGPQDTEARVGTGLRLLRELELDPRGFVAPGYAYTPALREVLQCSFDWFADIGAVWGGGAQQTALRSPALCLGSSTPLKRMLSPAFVRTAARTSGSVMRIDIHPADFDLPRHVATLEALLARGASRRTVTYDELVG